MPANVVPRTALAVLLVAGPLLVDAPAEARQEAAADASPSFERVLLGTTLGTMGGAAVGTGVALLAHRARGPDGAMLGILPELVLFGAPLAAAGAGVGAYLGSGRAADPWLTGAAAVAGVGAGLGVGVLVGDAVGPGAGEYVGAATGAVLAITLPALVAWATAR